MVYKPGSVSADHSAAMTIPLGHPLPNVSRDRPGRHLEDEAASLRAVPIWSCSRWGLPCRPRYRGRGALLPHPFTLTYRALQPYGGLLSVALSLGSPPPGVTRHRIFVEPGLSSTFAFADISSSHPTI